MIQWTFGKIVGPVARMLEGRFHFHKYSGDNFFPQEASSFLGSFFSSGGRIYFWKRGNLWKTSKNRFEALKELESAREVFYSVYFDVIISEIYSRCCMGQDNFSCLTKSSLWGNTICQVCRHAVFGVEFFKVILYISNLLTCFIKFSKQVNGSELKKKLSWSLLELA